MSLSESAVFSLDIEIDLFDLLEYSVDGIFIEEL